MKKKKRTRNTKIGAYKELIQREFNKLVTTKIGYCQRCGRRDAQMQCSHVKSIGAYPNLRFDIINVLCLDARCHKWWWHDEPTESGSWFKEKFPERWEYIQVAKNIPRKFTLEDLDQIREWIKNKEIDKLHLTTKQLKEYSR